MINVSAEFLNTMRLRRDFTPSVEINFTDGRAITGLAKDDFSITGNTVTDSAGGQSLPLGAAISRSIKISLRNDDWRYDGYDFFGARIHLSLTFRLSSGAETIDFGTFTVVSPETYGTVLTVTAQDDMYKADKPYTATVALPKSAASVLSDACLQCSIPLKSTQFANDSFAVEQIPDNLTCRQVIGYIAMIAGGNARIDRDGELEILTYSFDFSGSDYHSIRAMKSLSTDFNDIQITGVQTDKEVTVTGADGQQTQKTQTVLNGTEGYVLSVENPLAAGKEEDLLAYLATVLVGKRFWRFQTEMFAYPLAEFMDKVEITDRTGAVKRSVLTDVEFAFFGYTKLKNSAATAVRTQSRYSKPENKAIIAARKLVAQEATNREQAIKKLEDTLGDGSGMFSTGELQPDGSTIEYLHDKPTLAESQNIIKVTSDAIGISTDGGKTYPYGLTLDGDTIMRIVSAEGIEADWVKIGNKTITQYIQENYTDKTTTDSITQRVVNLETDNTQIKLAVDETKTRLETLQIGGRNLSRWSEILSIERVNAENDWIAEQYPAFANSDYARSIYNTDDQYTLSFEYSISGITTACTMEMALATADGAYSAGNFKAISLAAGNNSGTYTSTARLTDEQASHGEAWILSGFGSGKNAGAQITIKNWKFERGDKATDWAPAPEDLLDDAADDAQAKVDALEMTQEQKMAELSVRADGIASQVSQQTARQDAMEQRMTQIQQTADSVAINVQHIIDNGVDKVTTATGYTFNADGMRITKSGEQMENKLDNTGMYVRRGDDVMLQANDRGVIATDVTVRNYLIVGHLRFEQMGDATSVFYV